MLSRVGRIDHRHGCGRAADQQHTKHMMSIARKIRRFAPFRFKVVRPIAESDLSRKVILPPGYYPTNPSFVDTDLGRLLCVRGVNYRMPHYYTSKPTFTLGNKYHSINRFVLLDGRGKVIRKMLDLD